MLLVQSEDQKYIKYKPLTGYNRVVLCSSFTFTVDRLISCVSVCWKAFRSQHLHCDRIGFPKFPLQSSVTLTTGLWTVWKLCSSTRDFPQISCFRNVPPPSFFPFSFPCSCFPKHRIFIWSLGGSGADSIYSLVF